MILYKKDSKDKIRYLKVWSEGATIFNESGLFMTDSPIVHTKEAKPKNVGRSNETTAEEQAKSEVLSYIKKKLDEGYFESLDEVYSSNTILPMLAKEYSKEKHKIDWNNCYVNFKLDGMRCLAYFKNGRVVLMSRKGVEIKTMPHIEAQLLPTFSLFPNLILDGELYNKDLGSFQSQMKAIKKECEESLQVNYNVYDIVTEQSFEDRFSDLELSLIIKNSPNIKLVEAYEIKSEDDLKKYHSQFISEGFEGTMVRWGHEGYKINARSSNLLKYKDFIDITATIVDVIPSEQRPTWGTPVFEGFKAGTKMSHAEREDLLINKQEYIGKTAEIRFFEYTDEGLPRFPVMVGIRLDK